MTSPDRRVVPANMMERGSKPLDGKLYTMPFHSAYILNNTSGRPILGVLSLMLVQYCTDK